ncbi:MAG: hypothetical protein Q9170_002557 [Blastenia crenularia]
MPFHSPFANLSFPKTNILSFLFPDPSSVSDAPIWIDSQNSQETISAVDLLQWVRRIGVGFDKLGIKEGEIVLVYSPNHIFLPVIYLAIVANGRVFSGANPGFTAGELEYQLKDTGAQLLLSHPSLLNTACSAAKRVGIPDNRIFQFSEQENVPTYGILDWRALTSTDSDAQSYQWKHINEDEATRTIAAINYSSGTTGLPKGVCISHYNLIANVAQTGFMKTADTTWDAASERWIGFLPMYHAYGQLYFCLLAPKLGVPVYVMKQFNFEQMLQTIQRYRVTRLQVAPPVMVLLGKRPETTRYDLSSLKDITCGAAPLSGELQQDVSRKLNVYIKQGWGMTEATCSGLNTVGDEGITGSVGALFPNIEGKLMGEDGLEVPDGQAGELWLRGPNVSLGYWRNEKATKELITPDGWLKSGDIAVLREGSVFVVDRKKVKDFCSYSPLSNTMTFSQANLVIKELIKVKGFQVAPAELEAALLENDDIADAAAVGINIFGQERPRAYIVLKPEAKPRIKEADIHAWLNPRVSSHKHLTGGILFVDEVPKSASGKILRKVLREWAKRDANSSNTHQKAKL